MRALDEKERARLEIDERIEAQDRKSIEDALKPPNVSRSKR